jgi:phosphodiesterase/alkaline phosphatase D-like protein
MRPESQPRGLPLVSTVSGCFRLACGSTVARERNGGSSPSAGSTDWDRAFQETFSNVSRPGRGLVVERHDDRSEFAEGGFEFFHDFLSQHLGSRQVGCIFHRVVLEPAQVEVGLVTGEAVADPQFEHSVHVELGDLEPARTYWYRFFVRDHESEIARTRTTPAPPSMASRLVFGHVSCQNYNAGHWTAFEDLATADLDAVIHCGDYIYERNSPDVRNLDLPEPTDITGYRSVYAAYKSDPALRAAHSIAPWIATWDDHQVENNYQGDFPAEGSDTPIGRTSSTAGGLSGGVGEHARAAACADAFDPDFTALGEPQETRLRNRLAAADARYTLLQQGVVMQQWRFLPGDAAWNLDQWDGYPAARPRLFDDLRATGSQLEPIIPAVVAQNPHIEWAQAGHRGWTLHVVTPNQ